MFGNMFKNLGAVRGQPNRPSTAPRPQLGGRFGGGGGGGMAGYASRAAQSLQGNRPNPNALAQMRAATAHARTLQRPTGTKLQAKKPNLAYMGAFSDENKKTNVASIDGKPRVSHKAAASFGEREKNREKMNEILRSMGVADEKDKKTEDVSYKVSDENKKTSVKEVEAGMQPPEPDTGENPVDEMLNRTTPVSFNYKPEVQKKIGEDGRRNFGVMAQDLEKSHMGQSLVLDTPKGKVVDTKKATMANLAANARLNERINSLEEAIVDKSVNDLYAQTYGDIASAQMQNAMAEQQPFAPLADVPISPNVPPPNQGAAMADQVGGALQQGFEDEDPLRAVMRQEQGY